MADRDPEVLSEEEAARLWGRAAQLQAESVRRIEAPDAPGTVDAARGYSLTHVRSAALEAGIAAEFVDAALADLRAERALPEVKRANRYARRFLDDPPDTITARRIVDATPQAVLSAMEALFPDEPFRLTLADQQGDPLDRGVLVFDIQGLNAPFPQGLALDARWAGFKQVFVSLRPIEGHPASCEMIVRGPITSHNASFGVGLVLTGVTGGAGAAALGVLGLATGLAPVAAAAAVIGALLGGGLGVKGFRAAARHGLGKGTKTLDGLISAVAARAKGVWRGG